MLNEIRLGSRASALALRQAEEVKDLLLQVYPRLNCQIIRITTSGDRNGKRALTQFPGAGIFVKELENALQAGAIDAAVHSAKDLPSKLPRGCEIIAVLERGPVEDVLICRGDYTVDTIPQGSLIATGSPRRRAFLRNIRIDLRFCQVRGNVETRLRKLNEGDFGGLILAKAGLERLGLEVPYSLIRPPEIFLPAAGQGIIALEAFNPSIELRELLAKIDHPRTHICLDAERELLRIMDAGCSSPLGVYCRWQKNEREFVIDAGMAEKEGGNIFRVQVKSEDLLPVGLGEWLGREAGMRLLAGYEH